MIASVVNALNPLAIFLSSAVVVWLFIWGGIKMWHKQASKSLATKFKPFFDKIDDRMDAQDQVLENVNHEVTLNSGRSLKDEVKQLNRKMDDVMDVLTTKPKTALAPTPTLGLVDAIIEHGRTLEGISRTVARLEERSESSVTAATAIAAQNVLATASKVAFEKNEAAAVAAADIIVAAALAKLNLVSEKKPRTPRTPPTK